MSENESYFSDSEAYELAIGRWSRRAGEIFLDWLGLPPGLHWLDVGCGTGAFTELVIDRNAPGAISAIDPSEGQIAYARERPQASRVNYRQGDAMSMPYGENEFDVAVMALVVQYVPDPAKAMAEIYRVVRPEGTVAAYTWTVSPVRPVMEAFNSMGIEERRPPSDHMRSMDVLTGLFAATGIEDIADRAIEVEIDFETFDEFWTSQATAALMRSPKKFTDSEIDQLKSLVRERFDAIPSERISYMAQANAVRGVVRK